MFIYPGLEKFEIFRSKPRDISFLTESSALMVMLIHYNLTRLS